MPTATTETTYTLDASVAAALQRLAQQWQISREEALRRAVEQAIEPVKTPTPAERIAALHQLQKELRKKGVDFDAWRRTIREGRR